MRKLLPTPRHAATPRTKRLQPPKRDWDVWMRETRLIDPDWYDYPVEILVWQGDDAHV